MEKTVILIKEIDNKLAIVINDEPLDLNGVTAIRVEIDTSGNKIEVDKIDRTVLNSKGPMKETTEKFLFYR